VRPMWRLVCKRSWTTLKSDRVGLWRDKPDKFCMGLLTTFAPSEPHEFCIAGAGKCRILRAQVCEIISSHSWASFHLSCL